MLALTLLMVVVAILVGLIASRVSASIGRELRRDLLLGHPFSNADREFLHRFLITRTTNDIQQVQFTCHPAAHGGLRSHSGHRRRMHVTQGNTGLAWIVPDVAALLLYHGSDERRHAQVQNHADPGGQAEPRQLRDPDRRDAGACVQPRILEEKRLMLPAELMGTQLFTNRAMVAMMPFMT